MYYRPFHTVHFNEREHPYRQPIYSPQRPPINSPPQQLPPMNFHPMNFQQMPNQPPFPMMHQQAYYPPARPPLTTSVLNQFQDGEGQIDFNKMLATVGQLANTVQQVTPVIKQFGSFIGYLR
ncbi:MAG TPA: YppG family protein [Bacillota bacterium]|nr:YppG family protein [Bacillota bacterium]